MTVTGHPSSWAVFTVKLLVHDVRRSTAAVDRKPVIHVSSGPEPTLLTGNLISPFDRDLRAPRLQLKQIEVDLAATRQPGFRRFK